MNPESLANEFTAASVAGFLLALAFPPYHLPFLIPLAFGLQYWLMRDTRPKRTGLICGVFGVSFYLFHTYWLTAFQPIAFPLVLLGMGAVFGGWGLLVGLVGVNPWSAAAGWIVIQVFLEHFYLAFPWSRVASALSGFPTLIQPVALLGEVAWEALILLGICLLTEALLEQKRRTILGAGVVVSVILALAAWGYLRMDDARTERLDRTFLLVQPDVSMNWNNHDRTNYRETLSEQLVSLTRRNAQPGDVVVWPEASVLGEPVSMEENGLDVREQGGWPEYFRAVIDTNNRLLFGTLLRSPHPQKLDGLNLVVLLNDRLEVTGYYSKQIPVPFAERIPYMERSGLLNQLGEWIGTTGIRAGPNGGTIELDAGNRTIELALQICFEDSFGHYVKNQVHRGADVLVNVSNDGWSDSHTLHDQHFARAVVRAVETGRSLLRVGTTGITAHVSPFGVVHQQMRPYERGTLRARVFEPLGSTPYLRWSHLITSGLFILLAALGFYTSRRRPDEPTATDDSP